MKIEVCENPIKSVAFWLTKEERNNSQLKLSLKEQFAEWKSRGYLPVVFESGDCDLEDSTKQLIKHNAQVLANSQSLEEDAS